MALTFCASFSGAVGSKRPILWDFLKSSTVPESDSYVDLGISCLGTEASGGNVGAEDGLVLTT